MAFLPLVATLRLPSKVVFAVVATFLFIPGAYFPFIGDPRFPVLLRLVHGLELLGDSVVFGAVVTYLLRRGVGEPDGRLL